MRKLIVPFMAIGLSGCVSLASHPEIGSMPPIADVPQASEAGLVSELAKVKNVGNDYLKNAKSLSTEDQVSGGAEIGAGFYGAATSVFRPVVTNLQAAILGAGAVQGWRTGLKPGARAMVYAQGYRAMDCLHGAGSSLLAGGAGSAADAEALRRDIVDDLQQAAGSRANALNPDAGLMARLDAAEKTLRGLSATLKLEQDALADAPYRVGKVRRQIEDNVAKRLGGVAPDYEAVLKLIGETKKPPSSGAPPSTPPAPVAGGGGAPPPPPPPPPLSLQDAVTLLENEVTRIRSAAPTRATDAYENMGHCVEVTG
jgi:hypothetical protein